MSEASIKLVGTEPADGQPFVLRRWFNGPYEFDQGDPASINVTIIAPDQIPVPEEWSIDLKDIKRVGHFSVPIPFLMELLCEALEQRKHQLSDGEFKRLVGAAVAALEPVVFETYD